MASNRTLHHPTRNREGGVQQLLAVPPPNALHMHQAPGQKDFTQVDRRNVGDPSGMAQERKTKQGVDSGMSPPNSHVLFRLYISGREAKQYIEMAKCLELQ